MSWQAVGTRTSHLAQHARTIGNDRIDSPLRRHRHASWQHAPHDASITPACSAGVAHLRRVRSASFGVEIDHLAIRKRVFNIFVGEVNKASSARKHLFACHASRVAGTGTSRRQDS